MVVGGDGQPRDLGSCLSCPGAVRCGLAVVWQGHRSQQKFVSSRKSCQRIKTCIFCAVGTLGSTCKVLHFILLNIFRFAVRSCAFL